MLQSLPAWGAWVEIYADTKQKAYGEVAPRMGSVG